MSYLNYYVETNMLYPKDIERLLRCLLDEPVKQKKRIKTISHPALVKVKSGDGIGFDAGNYIAVSYANNNVGMLLKANYKEPFEKHESIAVAKQGITDIKDLTPGHTYVIFGDDNYIFVKYLGASMALVKRRNSCDIVKISDRHTAPLYELSLPF